MRVFVAGASGAIGTRLVPQLIDRGHEVIGTSRSPGKAELPLALGAEPQGFAEVYATVPASTAKPIRTPAPAGQGG